MEAQRSRSGLFNNSDSKAENEMVTVIPATSTNSAIKKQSRSYIASSDISGGKATT